MSVCDRTNLLDDAACFDGPTRISAVRLLLLVQILRPPASKVVDKVHRARRRSGDSSSLSYLSSKVRLGPSCPVAILLRMEPSLHPEPAALRGERGQTPMSSDRPRLTVNRLTELNALVQTRAAMMSRATLSVSATLQRVAVQIHGLVPRETRGVPRGIRLFPLPVA